MKFEKWEGLGNDFIVFRESPELTDEQVHRLCDRRFGIGADGVLFVEAGAVPKMIVRNADGSRPEMCGNGLRCVAAILGAGEIDVQTDAGIKRCVVGAPKGGVTEVEVDMGLARRGPDVLTTIGRRQVTFFTIDVGNPHAVTFDLSGDAVLHAHGARLSTSVPGGQNVEFCSPRPDGGVDVLVWERGVGPTMACGTGACAVAVAACAVGLLPLEKPLAIHLPGGPLLVTVLADGQVRMRGPARRVFVGDTEVI